MSSSQTTETKTRSNAKKQERKHEEKKDEDEKVEKTGDTSSVIAHLVTLGQGVLADKLDREQGHLLTDPAIFSHHAKQYETEFYQDMRSLGVRDADAITRVSEYITPIIDYVKRIMDRGMAYQANGSVYFDTRAFVASGHHYGKLAPWCVGSGVSGENNGGGDSGSCSGSGSEDGGNSGGGGGGIGSGDEQGSASRSKEKKHLHDFVLWKKSKTGEPSWESPWGPGRPGWHIECSAMAT